MPATRELPDRLVTLLRGGTPVVLMTAGPDGFPHSALTWAVATSADRVRFGVDHGSTTLANLERDGKAALQVIAAQNLLCLIKGPTRMLRAKIAAAPYGMAMWELAVTEVRDQTWAPVVVSPLAFAWTGPKADEMRGIEQAVLAELREWSG